MAKKRRWRNTKPPMPQVGGQADGRMLRPDARLVTLTARVPEPLYGAVKTCIDQEGITWRQLMRWALVQYLALKSDKAPEQVWHDFA